MAGKRAFVKSEFTVLFLIAAEIIIEIEQQQALETIYVDERCAFDYWVDDRHKDEVHYSSTRDDRVACDDNSLHDSITAALYMHWFSSSQVARELKTSSKS